LRSLSWSPALPESEESETKCRAETLSRRSRWWIWWNAGTKAGHLHACLIPGLFSSSGRTPVVKADVGDVFDAHAAIITMNIIGGRRCTIS